MSKNNLPPVVEALLQPQAYPHKTEKIKLVQTQMSFVFLTGKFVYKVKKAVNLGYLDYTTIEKRNFYCHQELKLNRRLCPNAYLDIVAINKDNDKIHINGKGETIEYATQMNQLPQEYMMDVLLRSGQLNQEMITRVAKTLVSFHENTETNPEISSFGKTEVISQNNQENFSQTERYIGISILSSQFDQILNYTTGFIDTHDGLFQNRIQKGRIRDCHGDLHAAHICLTNDICIYDCIEFNDRFRYSDVASEIAFLAMDLDRYQKTDLSCHFINAYVGLSKDVDVLKLLNFYKCYRAYVRGKVESFKQDDPHIPAEEKTQSLIVARKYFNLAESYSY